MPLSPGGIPRFQERRGRECDRRSERAPLPCVLFRSPSFRFVRGAAVTPGSSPRSGCSTLSAGLAPATSFLQLREPACSESPPPPRTAMTTLCALSSPPLSPHATPISCRFRNHGEDEREACGGGAPSQGAGSRGSGTVGERSVGEGSVPRARRCKSLFIVPAAGVVPACGMPEPLGEVGRHRLDGAWVGGRGRLVVEVDGERRVGNGWESIPCAHAWIGRERRCDPHAPRARAR